MVYIKSKYQLRTEQTILNSRYHRTRLYNRNKFETLPQFFFLKVSSLYDLGQKYLIGRMYWGTWLEVHARSSTVREGETIINHSVLHRHATYTHSPTLRLKNQQRTPDPYILLTNSWRHPSSTTQGCNISLSFRLRHWKTSQHRVWTTFVENYISFFLHTLRNSGLDRLIFFTKSFQKLLNHFSISPVETSVIQDTK